DAHRAQRHALGDTVGRGTHRAGDVRAMPVAILTRAAERIVRHRGPPAELWMARLDTRVDDVGRDPCPGARVGVRPAQRPIALVDAVDTPRGATLRGREFHD